MTNRQIKVKMREKTGFYKMRAGERETEVKCGRITRDACSIHLGFLRLNFNVRHF